MFTPAELAPALVRRLRKRESMVGGIGPALDAAPLRSCPPIGGPSFLHRRTPFHPVFCLDRCQHGGNSTRPRRRCGRLSNRVRDASRQLPVSRERLVRNKLRINSRQLAAVLRCWCLLASRSGRQRPPFEPSPKLGSDEQGIP